MIKIALDGMGGDLGYKEMVKGALGAANKELIVYLVGNENLLKEELLKYSINEYINIVHSSEIIEMCEEPALAFKKKKDASITVATKLVKDGICDAVVSAGSTGAQLTAGIFVLGRVKGIKRPGIVSYYPTKNGVKVMIDIGATPDCTAKNLRDFAIMASLFARDYLKMEKMTVGLLNNGSESSKGCELYKETHKLLASEKEINFYGNIEGRDITEGIVDVVVCDGFVGNIVLKLMEGLSKTLNSQIKEMIMSKLKYKIGGLFLKKGFDSIKETMDYKKYGGAPLLGVKGVSMICHGSSDGEVMANALRAAKKAVESGYQIKLEEFFNSKADSSLKNEGINE